jgi:hypothetical protein
MAMPSCLSNSTERSVLHSKVFTTPPEAEFVNSQGERSVLHSKVFTAPPENVSNVSNASELAAMRGIFFVLGPGGR